MSRRSGIEYEIIEFNNKMIRLRVGKLKPANNVIIVHNCAVVSGA